MNSIKRLREAFFEKPCKKHVTNCPIPSSNKKPRDCQWGHYAIEFADLCDECAIKFLKAAKIKMLSIAQRMHHQKVRQ